MPGAGWKSSRGAAPGTRKPRAGYYQNAKHEAVAAGFEADSDEDDDATELPPWNAMLRTGEELHFFTACYNDAGEFRWRGRIRIQAYLFYVYLD